MHRHTVEKTEYSTSFGCVAYGFGASSPVIVITSDTRVLRVVAQRNLNIDETVYYREVEVGNGNVIGHCSAHLHGDIAGKWTGSPWDHGTWDEFVHPQPARVWLSTNSARG